MTTAVLVTGPFATSGPENRTYKRDKDGKFGSGGGSGRTEADFDAAPTGADAVAAVPRYDQILEQVAFGRVRPGGIRPREAFELQAAIDGPHGYAREGYIETNRTLYRAQGGSIADAPQAVQDQIRRVDQVIGLTTLDHDIAVHRGTAEPTSVIPGFKPGGGNEGLTFVHHAFESASARHEVAEQFARGHNASAVRRVTGEDHPTAIRILVPAGTHAARLTDMDRYEGEGDGTGYAEILLPRGLTHRIVNDYGVINGVHFVDAEVVPND